MNRLKLHHDGNAQASLPPRFENAARPLAGLLCATLALAPGMLWAQAPLQVPDAAPAVATTLPAVPAAPATHAAYAAHGSDVGALALRLALAAGVAPGSPLLAQASTQKAPAEEPTPSVSDAPAPAEAPTPTAGPTAADAPATVEAPQPASAPAGAPQPAAMPSAPITPAVPTAAPVPSAPASFAEGMGYPPDVPSAPGFSMPWWGWALIGVAVLGLVAGGGGGEDGGGGGGGTSGGGGVGVSW